MHSFEYDKIKLTVFDTVYEPAEDSFMLAQHARHLKGRFLEVGCGCGIVALSNAKANPENRVIGVDINPDAVKCARANAKTNKIPNARFFKSNLFSNVHGRFDHILFNPPYLPTTAGTKLKTRLNLAFDGGRNGREATDMFLSKCSMFLKKDGKAFLVQSSLNGLGKTEQLAAKNGLKMRVLSEQSFFFEKLSTLHLSCKS